MGAPDRWVAGMRFACFDTETATGLSFETYRGPPGHVGPPDKLRWFAAPPTEAVDSEP